MKLRIRGNSLRLRLTQGEVAQFAEKRRVEEHVAFGASAEDRLAYVVEWRDDASALTAKLARGVITVTVPAKLARDWAGTERVSLETEQPIDGGGALRILIEKDFACLKPRSIEDDGDAFPNPNTSCGVPA